MIIDFRIKPPIPGWEKLFEEGRDAVPRFHKLQGVNPVPSNTLEETIGELDANGITHAVVMARGSVPGSSNDELSAFLSGQPSQRFIGFIGVDSPDAEGAVATIAKYAATGLFRGVSLNAHTLLPHLPVGDGSWDPIFETSIEHGYPVSLTLSGFLGMNEPRKDYEFARASRLVRALKKYPELKLIVSHGGWPFVSEAIAVASYYPNLYLSPDLFLGFPQGNLYAEAANLHLSDQLLYGSCYPNISYEFTLSRYRSYPWHEGVMRKVLYENGARLLGLPV
ncbi:amidohydrolase family protein [Cohnella cellulosilytica]|uniref:Amidohydrolase family protein n=1 Tax=Cohnella cellulosilytica TaxID=986710 RepID=A0ABW2FCQ5_9BACL